MGSFSFCRFALVLLVECIAFTAPARAVEIWLTTGDKSRLLQQQPEVLFEPGVGSSGILVSVVPSTAYQKVSGFGAAMTDSSAWLLHNALSAPQRDKLMQQLFSPQTGVGLNYLRVPIGASDFTASGFYTYNDNPSGGSDELQTQFSVAHDDAYIVPLLQKARLLNRDLRLMASPWSAPAWMKSNNSLLGGSLSPQWEASYALYLKRFIKAYRDRGLSIDAITLQNEPLHTSNYPTMFMPAAQQARLIANHLGPQLAAEEISAKILAYDHNWDNTAYPLEVLNDSEARLYAAGTAFHAYAGDVTAQTIVHNAYPDKDIYFTEITGGAWADNFADNLVWYSQNILIGSVRNWAKTALMWNLALDSGGGPHLGGCTNCRGVVTIDRATGDVTFNEEFYALGQLTRAVQPNAVRIGSTTSNAINTVAFQNPDGSRVLFALNPNPTSAVLRLYENGQHLTYPLPGKSVATFLWDANQADLDNGSFEQGGFQQGGGSLDAWSVFGDAVGNVSVTDAAALDGQTSLRLSGQFSGAANNSGVAQGISVSAGELVRAELSSYILSTDSIANTDNLLQLTIDFYSTYGATRDSTSFLGETSTTIADGSSLNDAWLHHQLEGIAPDGAAEARLILQFIQPNGQTGAIHVDDVSFGVVLTGDFNRDQSVDEADFQIWSDEFGGTETLKADADRDGDVDGNDFLSWQRQLGLSNQAGQTVNGVPEGRTQALAVLSGTGLFARRRRPPAPSGLRHESEPDPR